MCHVLIIEDELLVAMDLEAVLAQHGATSFAFAVTEDEAIAAAEACRPAIITTDVALVSGTGPSAVRTIQEHWGQIPVIFVTATPEACQPCEPPGRILTKPISERALTSVFREMLSS